MHAPFPRPQTAASPRPARVCPVCANARHVIVPAQPLQIGPGRWIAGALPARAIPCPRCGADGESEREASFGALGTHIVAFRPRTIDIAA